LFLLITDLTPPFGASESEALQMVLYINPEFYYYRFIVLTGDCQTHKR